MKKFLIAIAFAFALGAVASSAKADTTADIMAQIAALQAQLSGSMTAGHTFSTDLTIGSTGSEVTALQDLLISKGYLTMPAGVAKGYFGQLTKSAVAAWQASVGLPATGYFGPLSRGKVNAMGGSTTTTTTTTTTGTGSVACPAGFTCVSNTTSTSNSSLAGTDGSIEDVSTLSQYNNEEVGDGESDVKVFGFEVEASNDGDIALRSIKLALDPAGNGGSDNLDDYVDAVTVWQGTKKVGSANVDDFTQAGSSDIYTKTITLNGAVVKADATEKFYVTVDAVNNFDSGDISGDSWTISLDNIRFEDGSGVVTTEDSVGDIGDEVSIDFVSFSTAANTELKISTDSSNPEADIVVIDDQDNTDDVTLLVGRIKVEGTSDVLVDEIPVTFTTVGGANVAAVTGSVKLSINDEEYTESVDITSALTGTVTFDNLDLTLDAGKTYTFTVSADINDIDAGNLDEGDTLKASLTSTNRDYIDAENTEGDQLSDSSEKSGTATGEAQEFRTNGIAVALVSTNTSVAAGQSANDDQGTFSIKFKVTAIGDAVYISSLADATTGANTTGKTSVLVDRAGVATVGGTSVTITNVTDTDLTPAGTYMIEEGDSETFELITTVQLPTAGAAGQFRAVLGGIRWTTDASVSAPATSYTSNLDTFKTAYVGLN